MSNLFESGMSIVKYVCMCEVAAACLLVPPVLVPWYSPLATPLVILGILLSLITVFLFLGR